MKKIRGFPFKVALGYILLAAMTGAAALFIRSYTRTAVSLSDVERSMTARRTAANNLVYGILEVENREMAVCMGMAGGMTGYEQAVSRAQRLADSLSVLLADTQQRARVDTLKQLLGSKLANTRKLAGVLAEGTRQRLYEQKAARLRSGRDSLMLHSNVGKTTEEKQVTYVVEKTRPTFFGRLADAFRRQKSDTTAMIVDTLAAATDSVSHSINAAATVAGVLADIGRREERISRTRRNRIAESSRELQEAGMLLNDRTEQIMQSISLAERQWMQQAGDEDARRRQTTVTRIGMLAAAAVAVAIVLLAVAWRDNRRAGRYRRSLEEARNRAENLLEQRERLLLTITHDIKSPVAAISGFTELLRPHVGGGRPGSLLDNIRSSTLHLTHLVSQLLDYHQLEKGRMTVNKVSFSPARLIADCVESFRPRADEKGLALECRYSGGTSAVCRGDAFRIRQIAENLIGNALKYTVQGSVTVTAGISDGRLGMAVADTGQGMTAEESRRIFGAFTRLAGAQGIEGVGLGLSITRELVSLLGGTIGLDTAPGRGSTFTVELPVDVEAAAETPALPAELRILVIDDDALQLQLLCEMLRRVSGGRWSVTACSRVDEMLARIGSEPFDLLLTDIEMPAMNGFEIARRLNGRGIPVVAMTAHDTISTADFERAGFAARLHKPVSAEELAGVISDIVSAARPAVPDGGCHHTTQTEGLSFDALTAFADGDETAARDILDRFCVQTRADTAAMRSAAAHGDIVTAGSIAHRLLPLFTMIQSPAAPLLRSIADARKAETPPEEFGEWCRKAAEEMERATDEAAGRYGTTQAEQSVK